LSSPLEIIEICVPGDSHVKRATDVDGTLTNFPHFGYPIPDRHEEESGMAQQTKAKSSRSSSKRNTSRSRASSARRGASSSNDKGTVAAARDAVGSAAKNVKTPAIAAGAGLAGLAAGIALTRDRRKRVLGVPLPRGSATRGAAKDLAEVAKSAGALAERTGQVAEQVRVVSEALSQKDSPRRSPVEVLLEGLTRRSLPARTE
jgi:hypothetical protein